jgi:hypothetical protein
VIKTMFCLSISLVLLLSSGCVAMHRSNTAEYNEHMKVSLAEVVPPTGERPFAGGLAAIAVELGLQAASAIFDWEAKKYSQEAAKNVDHIAIGTNLMTQLEGEWELSKPLYMLVIRTISKKDVKGLWANLLDYLTWFDRPSKLETMNAILVQDIGTTLAGCDSNLTPSMIYQLIGVDPANPPSGHYLGFLALLRLSPSHGEAIAIGADGKHTTTSYPNGTIKIELLGYRYSALKAKNLGWIRIPFVDWHNTSSLFTVGFKGPLGDRFYSDQRQSVSTSFEVKWDREMAAAGQNSKWIWNAKNGNSCAGHPLQESASIRLVPMKDFSLKASIAESNSLRAVWEGIAKKVKDIEIKTGD